MTMWRSGLFAFCLAGGLAAAGCTDKGTYHVTWTFTGGESPGSGCGQHGVDSIRITGASAEGDGDDVTTLCARVEYTQEVPVGTWTFTFHQLDVRGEMITPYQLDDQGQVVLDMNNYPIPVPDPIATGTVTQDATIDLDPVMVVLTQRSACRDGIDNDRDGRVDLDDDGCKGNPYGVTEDPLP